MSVFTGEGDNQNQSTQQEAQTETNWLAKVVEKKGEKFSDPEEIAKGYIHSQDHIANLERQIEEMREDLGKNDYMKEVLERIESNTAKPAGGETDSNNNSGTDNTDTPSAVSVEQIKELVTQTLTEQEAQRTSRQNLEETDRQLTEAFGTDAKDRVAKRQEELGMSAERMKQLASESPTAFMALMGEAPKRETNQTSQSSVNTAGFNHQSGRKDWAYYQKMRKENPKLYYKASTQNEMIAQRQSLGEQAFYNR